jgi:hypothetical protein
MRFLSRARLIALTLLLGSSLVALGVVEASLRAFWPVSYRQPPRPSKRDAWQGLLHQRSSVPGLAYELAPSTKKRSQGTVIKTNSVGMRDKEYALAKGASTFRVAAIGDSFTFGYGVFGEEAYPEVLESLLNESAHDERQYEVLNFGVGGYDTRDEAVVLRHKALPWDPDLVILGYVLNDPEIEPIQPLDSYYQDVLWWQRSHVLRLIVKTKRDMDVRRFGGGDYIRYLHTFDGKWSSVLEAFATIRQITAAHGTRVVLAIFPLMQVERWADYPYLDIHQKVAAAGRAHGFVVLDLFATLAALSPAEVRVSVANGHPNALGHRLAAIAIRDELLQQELLAPTPPPLPSGTPAAGR